MFGLLALLVLAAFTFAFLPRTFAKLRYASRLSILGLVGILTASLAHAQTFGPVRVNDVAFYRATVGTTTAEAIPDVSVIGNLLSFKVCADSANTNYLAVGEAADADTDGVRLGANQCFVCEGCLATVLKALNVKGGAAGQGYTVLQHKKH